jgi:dsRNA-specific ribonuclease
VSIDIEAVKKAIGIREFTRTDLLEIALTHPSKIYQNDDNLNRQQQDQQEREYRRLAILGDAIFGAVVIDYLHQYFPSLNQGAITQWKSHLVSRKQCYEFAKTLKLRQLCQLGESEKRKDETEQQDLLGEMFEAMLAAIYLNFERNFSTTRDWLVEKFITNAVNKLKTKANFIEKQLLEESLQAVSQIDSDEATEILRQMKQKVDAIVAEDEKLQQLLIWINKKCLSIEPAYKPIKFRAFYLALVRLLGLGLIRNFDPTRGSASARQFAQSFDRARNIARDLALDVAFKRNPNTDPANVIVSIFTLDLEPELKLVLQKLQDELPDPKEEKERFEEWRQTNGRYWVEKITKLLGCDLQFSQQQKQLLKDYYDANLLLVEYLASNCNISQEVRQEIEDTLLLPIANLEQREGKLL